MVAIIVLGFIVIGAVEISLWPKRDLKQVLVYLVLLVFATTLSVLMLLYSNLPIPEPLVALADWLKKLWPGGDLP